MRLTNIGQFNLLIRNCSFNSCWRWKSIIYLFCECLATRIKSKHKWKTFRDNLSLGVVAFANQ